MVVAMVVATFLVCIAVSLILEARRLRHPAEEPARPVVHPLREEDLVVPQGLFLDGAHTWIGIHAAGLATVGVDGFLARTVGPVSVARLPLEGQTVHRGDEIVRLEAGSRALSIPAPLDGVVATVNGQLQQDPSALEADPYSRGWICTLRPSNLGKAFRSWRIAEDATHWLQHELQRLREFLLSRSQRLPAGATSLDGGDVAAGVLQDMEQEDWEAFRAAFLGRHPIHE